MSCLYYHPQICTAFFSPSTKMISIYFFHHFAKLSNILLSNRM